MPARPFRAVAIAVLVILAGLLPVAPLAARQPPDLSGTWTLVADEAATAPPAALGREFTIAQDATTLTLTQTWVRVSAVVRTGGQGQPTSSGGTTSEFEVRTPLRLDGSESPGLTPITQRRTTSHPVSWSRVETSVARAQWVDAQLVVVDFVAQRHAERATGPSNRLERRMTRLSFTLQEDGSLVVDRVSIGDPSPLGVDRAPRPLRSVYRRTAGGS